MKFSSSSSLIIFVLFVRNDFAVGRAVSKLLTGRIVGGEEAPIEEFPHQVSIEGIFGHFCGGSILTNNIVLTAAHCVEGANLPVLKVRVGSSIREQGGTIIGVNKLIVHPKYGLEAKNDYDIAILFLDDVISLSYKSHPIPLMETNDELDAGDVAIVTGWGKEESGNEDFAETLQKVAVPIIDQETCDDAYHNDGRITPRMFCAGYLNVGERDACQGDSGGPVLVNGKLTGVVSWGIGCASKNYPGVYTRISSVRDWIKQETEI